MDDSAVISTGIGAVIEQTLSTVSDGLNATDTDNAQLAFIPHAYIGLYGNLILNTNVEVWTADRKGQFAEELARDTSSVVVDKPQLLLTQLLLHRNLLIN